MKKFISAALACLLLLTTVSCDQTNTGTQTQASESVADTVHTEATSVVTMEPMETEAATIETVPVTEPPAETEPVTPPVGYGSEVTAFNSIREMIEKINNGDLSAGAQKIFDAYGCDTEQLRELTGLDEGFSESMVEWCGGFNYCINYIKDGQIISFDPYYTDEQFNSALSGLESWDNLLKNELLLNLEKTDLPTDEGFMYECTFDTAVVTGQRKTYHEFTGADGIQRVVTNWYGADGNPISGQIYVFDGHIPFSCYVSGLEADMELAKRLGTRPVLNENSAADTPATEPVEAQPQIVVGTVVYGETIPQNEIATDIHSERDVVECKYYDVGSFWRDVGSKTVRGSVAVKMKRFLSACTETGQSAAALTDSADTYIDVDSRNLPCKNDTEWYEADGVIYRYDRAEKTLARVNGHLGAGEYLHFDEQLLDTLKRDIGFWPYNYFDGTYKNGTLTIQHQYRADSPISIAVTGIQIDQNEGLSNSITLAVTAEQDMTFTISLSSEYSEDNLLDGYQMSVTLLQGEEQTVELPFIGALNSVHSVYISADNTKFRLSIDTR